MRDTKEKEYLALRQSLLLLSVLSGGKCLIENRIMKTGVEKEVQEDKVGGDRNAASHGCKYFVPPISDFHLCGIQSLPVNYINDKTDVQYFKN